MTRPKISIVTIAYNSAKTIGKTIESVLSQDYENKEYIIIDGGSTDGTQNIVQRYSSSIDIFVSEKDRGRSDAFNKGIKLASGETIVLLNSDDYLLPNALSRVAAEHDDNIDILCGNLILWNEYTDYKCRITPSLNFPKLPFFRRPAHQGLFIKKQLYERLDGYDINITYAMDLEFLMRATSIGATFKYINVDVAVFRLGGATSDSIFKKRKEYIYIIKKNGGTKFQAYAFYFFLIVTQTTKKLLKLTGIDIVRRLRYKKMN